MAVPAHGNEGAAPSWIIPGAHPRLWIDPADLTEWRRRLRDGADAELGAALRRRAEETYAQSHTYPEPPWLPDRARQPETWLRLWREAMNGSRRFLQGALLLAMAGQAFEEPRFVAAALERLACVAAWDPDGPTSIPHNDEPHMSVINWGPRVYDLCAPDAAPDLRAAILAGLSARAERTYRWLKDRGYGVRHTESHSGRMTGFLGELGIVLYHEHPEAPAWLAYVLSLMDRGYPFMGRPDGGWLEGTSYATSYVANLCHLAYALRHRGIRDLYQEPFLRHHLAWRRAFLWPGAPRLPFGDGQERAASLVTGGLALDEHLARVTGSPEHRRHVEAIRRTYGLGPDALLSPLVLFVPPAPAGPPLGAPPESEGGAAEAPGREAPAATAGAATAGAAGTAPEACGQAVASAHLFPEVGWLCVTPPGRRQVRLVARCAPSGTSSHQHADQGGFALYAGTAGVLLPTGIYDAYSSPHHHRWTRQSRAHNCLTLDGAGQIVRDPQATASFRFVREVPTGAGYGLVWAAGELAPAYGDRVRSYRRDYLLVGESLLLVRDRLLCGRGQGMPAVHLHSPAALRVQVAGDVAWFNLEAAGEVVRGCVAATATLEARVWQGYEPPPDPTVAAAAEPAPYHLDVHVHRCASSHDVVTAVWWPELAVETARLEDSGGFELQGRWAGRPWRLRWTRQGPQLEDGELTLALSEEAGEA